MKCGSLDAVTAVAICKSQIRADSVTQLGAGHRSQMSHRTGVQRHLVSAGMNGGMTMGQVNE